MHGRFLATEDTIAGLQLFEIILACPGPSCPALLLALQQSALQRRLFVALQRFLCQRCIKCYNLGATTGATTGATQISNSVQRFSQERYLAFAGLLTTRGSRVPRCCRLPLMLKRFWCCTSTARHGQGCWCASGALCQLELHCSTAWHV